MFLWRSLSPTTLATVAAALTRDKPPAKPPEGVSASTGATTGGDADGAAAEGIAKN